MKHLKSANEKTSGGRIDARLAPNLEKNLLAYVAAATAAGVGVFGIPQQAEAKVVFTPANISISNGNPVHIDLTGDGTTAFTFIRATLGSHGTSVLSVSAPTGNSWIAPDGRDPAPLVFGEPIGPGGQFAGRYDSIARFSSNGTRTGSGGIWADKTNRYMGLKFLIEGETHFGWLRMTVAHGKSTVTGYAYETVPNKAIKAGHTHGPQTTAMEGAWGATQGAVQGSASLGLLALGADGLAILAPKRIPFE